MSILVVPIRGHIDSLEDVIGNDNQEIVTQGGAMKCLDEHISDVADDLISVTTIGLSRDSQTTPASRGKFPANTVLVV